VKRVGSKLASASCEVSEESERTGRGRIQGVVGRAWGETGVELNTVCYEIAIITSADMERTIERKRTER
jgi:predicted sugar kinase